MGYVIVIAILVAIAWFLIALPARRRQRSHAAMQDDIVVGDEIITAGGMHAIVREAGDDRAPDRDRARSRGHPRPAGGCGGRARNPCSGRTRSKQQERPARKLTCSTRLAARRSHLTLLIIVLALLGGVALLAIPSSPGHRKLSRGPRPPGRHGARAQGEAAEGRAADLVDDGQRGQHRPPARRQAGHARAGDHEAGHRRDRRRAARDSRPGAGGARSSAPPRSSSSTT